MRAWMQKALRWIGKLIAEELTEPLEEIKKTQEAQGKAIAKLQESMEAREKVERIAEECDLAVLDDRICTIIATCRANGYTTAEERRRVERMHAAYKARGGNHGEDSEHDIFCRLPTQEEYERRCKNENQLESTG